MKHKLNLEPLAAWATACALLLVLLASSCMFGCSGRVTTETIFDGEGTLVGLIIKGDFQSVDSGRVAGVADNPDTDRADADAPAPRPATLYSRYRDKLAELEAIGTPAAFRQARSVGQYLIRLYGEASRQPADPLAGWSGVVGRAGDAFAEGE